MGYITKFIDLFYMPQWETNVPPAYSKQRKKSPPPPVITEREKLEMQARFIIKKMGSDPDTVTYMSNGLLQAVINDYIKENRS